jgi:hypothetical protein
MLELKYPQIADVVSEVNNKNLEYQEFRINNVFVINVEKIADGFEFSMKLLNKTELPSILRDTKDTLYGYFEINNRPVVVFGDSASYFFSKTNDSKEFDWLKPSPPLAPGELYIVPKDDRMTWVYRFEKGEFKFYKKCHCGILDLSKREEYDPISSEMISIALNSKEMKQYYHFEIKERRSLVIVNEKWFGKPIDTILIFGRKVKIIDTPSPELTNFISVISRKRKEDKLELEFEYKIEGLLIKVELVINNGAWRKNNISIIENKKN